MIAYWYLCVKHTGHKIDNKILTFTRMTLGHMSNYAVKERDCLNCSLVVKTFADVTAHNFILMWPHSVTYMALLSAVMHYVEETLCSKARLS